MWLYHLTSHTVWTPNASEQGQTHHVTSDWAWIGHAIPWLSGFPTGSYTPAWPRALLASMSPIWSRLNASACAVSCTLRSLLTQLPPSNVSLVNTSSEKPFQILLSQRLLGVGIPSTALLYYKPLGCTVISCLLLSAQGDYGFEAGRDWLSLSSWEPPTQGASWTTAQQHLRRKLWGQVEFLPGISETKFFLPKTHMNSSPNAH